MRGFRSGWMLMVAAGLTVVPTLAEAQIFTPTFMAPRGFASLGAYLSDQGAGDFAVEGILRAGFGTFDLGVRAGLVDTGGTDLTLGAEYRNPLAVGAAPIDVSLTAAAQALIGDADWTGVQAGLSIGTTVVPGSFSLTPYIHPRLAFINPPGDRGFESELLAEIGADLDFGGGILRFTVGLDDFGSDWGLGLAVRR